MTDYEELKLALEIAKQAHAGQVDKAGVDYIFHPITVALLCNDPKAKIVALLHDTIEDTDMTIQRLQELGFDQSILDALLLLTHDPSEPYMSYVERIKNSNNKLAIEVKISDLTHNLDVSRLGGVKPKKYATYQYALEYLRN